MFWANTYYIIELILRHQQMYSMIMFLHIYVFQNNHTDSNLFLKFW